LTGQAQVREFKHKDTIKRDGKAYSTWKIKSRHLQKAYKIPVICTRDGTIQQKRNLHTSQTNGKNTAVRHEQGMTGTKDKQMAQNREL
jgi:hypothetical protein